MELNKLKVVLVERMKIGKWLTETFENNEVTVSHWCANASQPSLKHYLLLPKC